jgi:TPR repeat protein
MDNCSCSFCLKGDTNYCLKKIVDIADDMLNNGNTNAITYYEKAHKEGDPSASLCLAEIYEYLYVMSDEDTQLECYEKALYWYKISLDNDTINVAASIATLYHMKYNTDKNLNDLKLCINWYEQAILKETKDVGSHMYSLGMLYIETINPPNYDLAMKYFVKAVDKGHWRAAAKLSCMYFRGIRVKQNYETSDEWKDKADAIINDKYPDADSREHFQQRISCIARSERLYIS